MNGPSHKVYVLKGHSAAFGFGASNSSSYAYEGVRDCRKVVPSSWMCLHEGETTRAGKY